MEINWKRKHGCIALGVFVIVALVIMALMSGCSVSRQTSNSHIVSNNDTSGVRVKYLQERLDSVYLVLIKLKKIKDSSILIPPRKIDVGFLMTVDSSKNIKPFHSIIKTGNSYLHIFSDGKNNLRIIDSSAALVSRFTTEINELESELHTYRYKINEKDSMIYALRSSTIMTASTNVETQFKTPNWAIWAMLIEALVILGLLLMIKIK